MNALDRQAELALARPPRQVEIPVELVRAKRSAGAAFSLACDASGLEDKEIYLALDIDPGTFSRIKKGTNTLPADMLATFCRVVGNVIYADWLAFQIGCGLVVLQTEAERRAIEAEAALAQERVRYQALLDAFRAQGR